MKILQIIRNLVLPIIALMVLSIIFTCKTYAVDYSKNGWQKNDSGKYVYVSDGKLAKGWIKDEGSWYYLDPSSGLMQTGWVKVAGKWYYFASGGEMQTGFQEIGGKKYLFKNTGTLLTATGWKKYAGSWYYINADGSLKTGWFQEKGYWYYLSYYGSMFQETFQLIDEKHYAFDSYGHMVTGWCELYKGRWYYFQSDGSAAYGLYSFGNDEYYFYEQTVYDGGYFGPVSELALNYSGCTEDHKQIIVTDSNGMVTQKIIPKKNGWTQVNGSWYYAEDGILATGLKVIGNYTYGFLNNGHMLIGSSETIGYGRLCFDESGHLIKNRWINDSGKWYYYGEEGYIAVGLNKIGNYWYYFPRFDENLNDNFSMYTGFISEYWPMVDVPGTRYFDENGHMCIGWFRVNADNKTVWYYANKDGVIQTGWQTINGKTYFFKSTGAMASNEWCEGYWLNSNGTWTYKYQASWKKNSQGWRFGDSSGWYAKNETITIDGKKYTFDAAGYWVK